MAHASYQAISSYYAYVKKFLASPSTMGSIAPSSHWLCNEMIRNIVWEDDLTVAELGAGMGVITQHILRNMSTASYLDAYEIENNFIIELNKINDSRLNIYANSAENLSRPYHIIFSGIPFLSLDIRIGLKILKQVNKNLHINNGRFILFQYTRKYEKALSRYFNFERKRVLFNIPPAFVYICSPK